MAGVNEFIEIEYRLLIVVVRSCPSLHQAKLESDGKIEMNLVNLVNLWRVLFDRFSQTVNDPVQSPHFRTALNSM
jgi:hypothetical protein